MGVGFEWMVLDFARGERREGGGGGVFAFEEVADGDCGGFRLTVGDVVVGEATFVEETTLGFVGGGSFD